MINSKKLIDIQSKMIYKIILKYKKVLLMIIELKEYQLLVSKE